MLQTEPMTGCVTPELCMCALSVLTFIGGWLFPMTALCAIVVVVVVYVWLFAYNVMPFYLQVLVQ